MKQIWYYHILNSIHINQWISENIIIWNINQFIKAFFKNVKNNSDNQHNIYKLKSIVEWKFLCQHEIMDNRRRTPILVWHTQRLVTVYICRRINQIEVGVLWFREALRSFHTFWNPQIWEIVPVLIKIQVILLLYCILDKNIYSFYWSDSQVHYVCIKALVYSKESK